MRKRVGRWVLRAEDFFSQTGMPLYVRRWRDVRPTPRHAHEFTELVVILGGRGVHRTGRHAYLIAAGDVFVIHVGETHGYEDLGRLELINILFDPVRLRLPDSDIAGLPGYHVLFSLEPRWRNAHKFRSRLHLDARSLNRVERLVLELEQELQARAEGYRFVSRALFMQVLGHLSRCYAAMRQPESRSLLGIGKALSHIEEHYAEPVPVRRLCEVAGMSESTLLRAFKRALGISPKEHLLRLRVRKAVEAMADPRRTITEAAFAAGFADSNYFSRQFRKIMGLSPREYRRLGGPPAAGPSLPAPRKAGGRGR